MLLCRLEALAVLPRPTDTGTASRPYPGPVCPGRSAGEAVWNRLGNFWPLLSRHGISGVAARTFILAADTPARTEP